MRKSPVLSEDSNKYTTILPADYKGLIRVGSLRDLFAAVVSPPEDVNVILFRRRGIEGDFDSLARKLFQRGIILPENEISDITLRLSDEWQIRNGFDEGQRQAANIIRQDVTDMLPFLLSGNMRLQPPDMDFSRFDVGSFHDDGDRWRVMCCYTRPVTEWLKDDDAEIVEKKGTNHRTTNIYRKTAGATVYRFKPGDIWAHAGTKDRARGFAHRAVNADGITPRLLTVAQPHPDLIKKILKL